MINTNNNEETCDDQAHSSESTLNSTNTKHSSTILLNSTRIKTTPQHIKIIHWNCNSIYKKQAKILQFLHKINQTYFY